MTDRDELRRLIDVIEKSSGSGSVEQAVDDIKTFANNKKINVAIREMDGVIENTIFILPKEVRK
mgnify:CR=1 FL=1